MKNTLMVLGGILLSGIIIYGVRSNTEPKFSIEYIDFDKKEGEFVFSGIRNKFGIGRGVSVQGRNGYSVVTGSSNNLEVYFKLYKNGKFVRELQTILLVGSANAQ